MIQISISEVDTLSVCCLGGQMAPAYSCWLGWRTHLLWLTASIPVPHLSTGLLPTNHSAVAKHLGCSQICPLVGHYLDIRREGTQMLMQSGCENISRATSQTPSLLSPTFCASVNLSLSPSIIAMSPAPLGKFPLGELTAKELCSV